MDLKQILSVLTKYRDKFGLLVQRDLDAGDSLQRTSSLYALLGALKAEQDDRGKSIQEGCTYDLALHGVSVGRFRRHPDGKLVGGRYIRWYANPNNVSRDQTIVMEAAMVINKCKDLLSVHLKQRLKRGFLHFNTESYDDSEPVKKKFPDIPNPIEFALIIRGLDLEFLYPLLYLLDLQLLTDLYFRKGVNDADNMYLPIMLASLSVYPTLIGKLAKKLYARTNAVECLRNYHSEADGKNGIEPLGELYELAFNTLIKGK